MVKTALINNIIPFSNVDGPGNRLAIFFQGCPLSCLYCHNPETIKPCIHCGTCVKTCPTQAIFMKDGRIEWDQTACIDCDTCIHVCPHLSTPKAKRWSLEELVAFIKQRRPFIEGITVSGGECMTHAPYLLSLFKEIKPLGLTCLIDSNGAYDFSAFDELVDLCDGVMLDIKAVDPLFHQAICHFDNSMILKNLTYLQSINKLTEVRTVLLPNQQDQNIKTVSYVSQQLQDHANYKLLRYRPYGVRPAGINYFGDHTVSMQEAETYKTIAMNHGQQRVIIV